MEDNHRRLSPAIAFDFGAVLMDWNPHYWKMPGYDRQAGHPLNCRLTFEVE
jgi:hypothetical protein